MQTARLREPVAFAAVLAAILAGFFHETLIGGKSLSSGDVVYASASFGDGSYEPANRLLMDPVLQFAPWLSFNREMIRSGRLPLWNPWSGCGTPHLANGQSAVFDPFHAIAYVGSLPWANAWMAAARLWVTGMGMFLLAGSWQIGPWGRWFAGLSWPFCGFLVVWMLYPVTNVAIWMPWLFLATERVLNRPGPRSVGGLALVTGFVILGGHIQTSAHVLLAAGLYAVWRWWPRGRRFPLVRHGPMAWSVGIVLGFLLAAVEILPLAAYLSKSPVWADRRAEMSATSTGVRPRLLSAVGLAFPYAYGSQRRGHPNLAPALGVDNLNESSGGFAGLAALVWLAPLAAASRRRNPCVYFLAGLALFGLFGSLGLPPVSNLLRILPVLDVADNRRLSLWVAFGVVILAGIGLDSLTLTLPSRGWRFWTRSWFIGSILAVVAAGIVIAAGPWIRSKAIAHYDQALSRTAGAEASVFRYRAERQAHAAATFLPKYYLLAAGQLAFLAVLAGHVRRHPIAIPRVKAALLGTTMIELFAFGYGLNPAISPRDDRPDSELMRYLRREVPPPQRLLAVGAELPPNVLMRYGLRDVRNYDSIELSSNLRWFESMYEPDPRRPIHTSRREIRWAGVMRARERLRLAGVTAVVGASPPPEGVFERVDRVGRVWVGRWTSLAPTVADEKPGEIRVDLRGNSGQVRWIAETYDAGWKAEIDGSEVTVKPHLGTFLSVDVPPGSRRLLLRYDPIEVRVSLMISIGALSAILLLCGLAVPWRKSAFHLGRPRKPGYNRFPVLVPVLANRLSSSLKDATLMVHFTCDLCGKDLTSNGDPRYVVKIAAYAGFDPNQISGDDLEDDHMEAVSELLRREEADGSPELDAPTFKGFRFDLCSDCHCRFLKDPLNRNTHKLLNFSKN